MSDEDNQIRGVSTRVDETGANSFDELARGLADGTISRRRALKLVGGAILGAGTLALFPGVSGAQDVTESTAQDVTESAIGDCPSNPNFCQSKCRNTGGRECRCVHGVNNGNIFQTCVRPCCRNKPNKCNSKSDCRSTEVCMFTACCENTKHNGICATKCGEKRPHYCGNGISFG
jgi:hypothetical protein